MLKKAMIMAAGVGSRLEALSNALPKPLVPLVNVAAMDILVKHLSSFGINKIIANTYYKSDVIISHYNDLKINAEFEFIKETELSGTAGGVKKCQFFFDKGQDFIVMSGDGLSDIDINKAYESHKKSGSVATIVLKKVQKQEVSIYGIVVPDEKGYVKSFQEKPRVEEAKSNFANTGIYIFNYEIFNYIPENTFFDFAKNVFPSLLSNGKKINTFIMDGYWSDIGSLRQYKQSNFDLLNHRINSYKPYVNTTLKAKYYMGENVKTDNTTSFEGNCVIGNNCTLGKNSEIVNSILWNDVTIADNVRIEDSIVLNGVKIEKSVKSEIIAFDIMNEDKNITV